MPVANSQQPEADGLRARVLEYITAKRLLITKRHLDAQVDVETEVDAVFKEQAASL